MARQRKEKTREERVQTAAKQMKAISILFVLTAIGALTTGKYVGNRKVFFVGLFILMAVFFWRQGNPDKIRHFPVFDKKEKKGMF